MVTIEEPGVRSGRRWRSVTTGVRGRAWLVVPVLGVLLLVALIGLSLVTSRGWTPLGALAGLASTKAPAASTGDGSSTRVTAIFHSPSLQSGSGAGRAADDRCCTRPTSTLAREVLTGLAGVEQVDIAEATGTVTVSFDYRSVTASDLARALRDAGLEVHIVSSAYTGCPCTERPDGVRGGTEGVPEPDAGGR